MFAIETRREKRERADRGQEKQGAAREPSGIYRGCKCDVRARHAEALHLLGLALAAVARPERIVIVIEQELLELARVNR